MQNISRYMIICRKISPDKTYNPSKTSCSTWMQARMVSNKC